ncbi:MAG: serine/threonine protein kinase [Deltaproteobacteria bacterium]|nr:serine/threonine protein kinase [Deltaproteobacteria bacterium]
MGVAGAAPGDVIDKYRVEREIAQGGMSIVVAARHTALDRTVAIKLLVRPEGLLPQEAGNRFVREARAAARIESDHVCRVFDVGMLGATPYMVMEYLEGSDLESELERRGALPPGEAVDLVLQALEGLAVAHDLGIVHRDLKPANLFLARRPDGQQRVKLLDFGISKVEGRDANLTDTQGSFGTPLYMSPEQVKNAKHTDLRTDIWAMGAILYELVAGRTPFQGETSGEVMAAVLEERHEPLSAIVPGVDEGLSNVIERCLIRDRDRRFASARELAAALAPFAAEGSGIATAWSTGASSRIDSTRLAGLSSPTLAEPAPRERPPRPTGGLGWSAPAAHRSRRTVGIIAGAAAIMALVGGAIAMRHRRGETTPAPVTAAESSRVPAPLDSAPAAPIVEPANGQPPSAAPSGAAPALSVARSSPPRSASSGKSRAAPPPRASGSKTEAAKSASDILKDSY